MIEKKLLLHSVVRRLVLELHQVGREVDARDLPSLHSELVEPLHELEDTRLLVGGIRSASSHVPFDP